MLRNVDNDHMKLAVVGVLELALQNCVYGSKNSREIVAALLPWHH